jgi:atypical dual specificity phosphatase
MQTYAYIWRSTALTRYAERVTPDDGNWLIPNRLLACAYPWGQDGLAHLTQQGISVIVNLHERAHEPARLTRLGLTEIHLPVADFTAPSPEQLARGVAVIEQSLAEGQNVAVHCAAGLGRTGTLLASYLVASGLQPAAAIDQIRLVRPGSVETGTQVAAVNAFAREQARRTAVET